MNMISNKDIQMSRSAYFDPEWVEFNADRYGLVPEKVQYTHKGASLDAILYKNRNGQICLPAEDRYLSLTFALTNSQKECQLYNQRLELMSQLADTIAENSIGSVLALPPGFTDARPFMWHGFKISVGYTFFMKLPFEDEELDSSVRNKCKKAEKNGYIVKRTSDWEKVIYCYNKTREYKSLGKYVTLDMLKELDKKTKSDSFVISHIAENTNGEPVCAQIKLFSQGGTCIDWVAGTDRNYIKDGVNQLTYYKSISELAEMGGYLFDYCGANDRDVAQAKSSWGGELIPYLIISKGDLVDRAKILVKKNSTLSGIYRNIVARKK